MFRWNRDQAGHGRPSPLCVRLTFRTDRLGLVCSVAALVLLATGSAQARSTAPGQLSIESATLAGGQPVESAVAAIEGVDGNLVVVGNSLHVEPRDTSGRSGRVHDSDVFIARYGPDGALLGVSRLGGDGWDEATGLDVDKDGNLIVVGHTTSRALVFDPQVPDALRSVSDVDGFVVVLDGDADEMLASTFVGGSADDWITGLVVDSDGVMHVSGTTRSADLFMVAGADTALHGRQDGFVAGLRRLDGEMLELSYLEYVGGNADDALNGIALFEPPGESRKVIAVAGMTESSDRSLRDAAGDTVVDGTRAGFRDALIAMLEIDEDAADPVKPIQVTPIQITVYGSSGDETANAIAMDKESGDVFVIGRVVDMEGQLPVSRRPDGYDPLPTTIEGLFFNWPAHVQRVFQGGDSDGFLLRLVRRNTPLRGESWVRWLSTYLGGDGDDTLTSVALDGEWVHVVGATRSSACQPDPGADTCPDDGPDGDGIAGLPIINAFDAERGVAANGVSPSDGFYARIRQRNRTLASSAGDIEVDMATYLGGGGAEDINSVVVVDDSVWLVGQTVSPKTSVNGVSERFPVSANAAQPESGTDDDNFLQAGAEGIGLDADAFVVQLSDASKRTIESGDVERTYYLTMPSSASGPVPVVLVFHGGGRNALTMAEGTRMHEVGEANDFAVVYAEGLDLNGGKGQHWNDGRPETAGYGNDLQFVDDLVNHLVNAGIAAEDEIYATGISNGGIFTHRLACERPQLIAAFAAVAASLPVDYQCAPGQSVPVMMIHGTADRFIDYESGTILNVGDLAVGGQLKPVEDSVKFWGDNNNNCNPLDSLSAPWNFDLEDNTIVEVFDDPGCNAQANVVFLKVVEGGHTWPDSSGVLGPIQAGLVGNVTREFNGSRQIWCFFDTHPERCERQPASNGPDQSSTTAGIFPLRPVGRPLQRHDRIGRRLHHFRR